MSKDITQVLKDWYYRPNEVIVRIVRGEDGQDKVQLRVDLGLLQMEMDGRPDGQRPEGRESWLEYYQQKQQEHDEKHPDAAPFMLENEDCEKLLREGVQYYHRYLSLWHLDRYDLCARDTARNLELFAFVREHAREDKVKMHFDQWRPYVTMMHAQAVAKPLVEKKQFEAALEAVDAGIDSIRDFLDEYGQGHRADECVELLHLERWRKDIALAKAKQAESQPESAVRILRRKLDEAVAAEAFEEAARLRDRIRGLLED